MPKTPVLPIPSVATGHPGQWEAAGPGKDRAWQNCLFLYHDGRLIHLPLGSKANHSGDRVILHLASPPSEGLGVKLVATGYSRLDEATWIRAHKKK